MSWAAISPDLTRDEKSSSMVRRSITGDNFRSRILLHDFCDCGSRCRRASLAGTDDGLVHLTRDGGKTWTNGHGEYRPSEWDCQHNRSLPIPTLPSAYVVVDAHRLDNMKPYAWKPLTSAVTWKGLAAVWPQDVLPPLAARRIQTGGMLYAGSEHGVLLLD